MELSVSMFIFGVLLLLCAPAAVKGRCPKDESGEVSGTVASATTTTTTTSTSTPTTTTPTTTTPTTTTPTTTTPTTTTTANNPTTTTTQNPCNCDDSIQCCFAGVQCRLRPPEGEACGVDTCPCLEGTCVAGYCTL